MNKPLENVEKLNRSGIALTDANQPHEAVTMFEKALSIDPQNPLLWFNLGITRQNLGEYKEALSSFKRAVSLDKNLVDAWGSMGLIHYELEQYNTAEDCYHTALSLDNDASLIWNNLGVLYFTKGEFGEARHCFEEALSAMPDYYDALFNLRDTCRELNDFPAAAEFEKLLSQYTPRESKRKYNTR